MATTTLSRLGDGSFDPATQDYTPSTVLAVATISSTVERWLQFDHEPVLTGLGGSRITAMTIQLAAFLFDGGSGTLTFFTTKYPTNAVFSTANPPTPRSVAIGTVDTTLPQGTNVEVTIPISSSDGVATGAEGLYAVGAATPLTAQLGQRTDPTDGAEQWTAIGATWSGNSGLVTFHSFEATYEENFTGIQGPYQAYGRADECPKCGHKSTRDTWTRDGYTDMMVCAECYDEEDLVGRHYQGLGSERPGQGEG